MPFVQRLSLSFLLLLAFVPCSAKAHPYAFIDYSVEAFFGEPYQLIALRQHWLFDDNHTATALRDYDENDNNKLDPDELMDLSNTVLITLKDLNYFTSIRENGQELCYEKVTDIVSRMEGDRIRLSFTIWLVEPVDVQKNEVDYRIYDSSYYTKMAHEAKVEAITLNGDGAKGCTFDLFEPEQNKAKIEQASKLSKDSAAPDQLGSFFAQKVTLSCP